MEIVHATTPAQIAVARELFQEYAAWLGIDLCFQGFTEELANLPGAYARPRGRLLIAVENAVAAGCVAMRPFGDNACEMKRLFVRPAHRRRGVGRALVARIVAEAAAAGYASMLLDTLPHMRDAIRLYESFGFVMRPAYYETPLRETVFMELRLKE